MSDSAPTDTDEEECREPSEPSPSLVAQRKFRWVEIHDPQLCRGPPHLGRTCTKTRELIREWRNSSKTLPWSWSVGPLHRRLAGPYSPFNQLIYNIVTDSKVSCTLIHCLPHSDVGLEYLAYDWPCGCEDPPLHEGGPPDKFLHHANLGWLSHVACNSGKKAAVWNAEETFFFFVPGRAVHDPSFHSSSRQRRKRTLHGRRIALTDRKRYRYGDYSAV